jgi:hypothetical protein
MQRTNIATMGNLNLATTPSLVEAFYKALSGAQDISPGQLIQFRAHTVGAFQSFHEAFLQRRDGLIPDHDFVTTTNTIAAQFRFAGARLMWKQIRSRFATTEYVEFVDAILARTAVEPYVNDPSEWLRDWAKESAISVGPS